MLRNPRPPYTRCLRRSLILCVILLCVSAFLSACSERKRYQEIKDFTLIDGKIGIIVEETLIEAPFYEHGSNKLSDKLTLCSYSTDSSQMQATVIGNVGEGLTLFPILGLKHLIPVMCVHSHMWSPWDLLVTKSGRQQVLATWSGSGTKDFPMVWHDGAAEDGNAFSVNLASGEIFNVSNGSCQRCSNCDWYPREFVALAMTATDGAGYRTTFNQKDRVTTMFENLARKRKINVIRQAFEDGRLQETEFTLRDDEELQGVKSHGKGLLYLAGPLPHNVPGYRTGRAPVHTRLSDTQSGQNFEIPDGALDYLWNDETATIYMIHPCPSLVNYLDSDTEITEWHYFDGTTKRLIIKASEIKKALKDIGH